MCVALSVMGKALPFTCICSSSRKHCSSVSDLIMKGITTDLMGCTV